MHTKSRAAPRPVRPGRADHRLPAEDALPFPATGRAPSSRFGATAVLAGSLVLGSCGGGGDGPPDIPGATPPQGAVFHHEVPGVLPPGEYALSGALAGAVRIGIEDSPVDFTHPIFHGRVQLEGAGLAYWRPLASQVAQRAFESCTRADPCRVFLVDSEGDPARLQELARTVLEVTGHPVADNRWYLHDRSQGEQGWYELPSRDDLSHGTLVAQVALGRRFHPFPAQDTVIVPMAVNFDPVEQFEEQHYFADLATRIRNDRGRLDELDGRYSRELRRRHDAADVINASYGLSADLNSIGGKDLLRTWRDDLDLLRDDALLTWGEFVQRETPFPERTIRVWSAGNHQPGSGVPASGATGSWYDEFPNVLADDGYRNLNSLGPFFYPELRGEHIRVTALGTDEERLAPYADPCGELPAGWNASRYGRHYCLAAPGTLSEAAQGTSFAAPFVSGVLARMMKKFPGTSPRELVGKLMDTADGYRMAGFDGGIYVVQVEGSRDPVNGTVHVVSVARNGDFEKISPPFEVPNPTYPEPQVEKILDEDDMPVATVGEFQVVQRGCAPRGTDHLSWTGEAGDFCVVWRGRDPIAAVREMHEAVGTGGTPNETETVRRYAREALAMAEERFAYVYGAGRVDPDEALRPKGTTRVSAPGVPPAPVASSRLRAPSAWGALGDRLSGLSLAAFDDLDFPFFYRLDDLVADGSPGGASPIPDFLPDPARTRACDPLRQLAPGLLCTPWANETRVQALTSPDGTGAAFRLGDGVLVSGFTRGNGRLDGAGSGAFSFESGSSLAALHFDRVWTRPRSEPWQVDASLTIAADLPRGLGTSTPSLFTAGTSLLSEWSIGLTRTGGAGRTRLSLTQPPRAEAGHGRFTVPSGRREDGTRLYETHRASLVPSHRELTWRLAHQRPFRGGELVLSVHRTRNRGHRAALPEHGAGVAYRRSW